MGLTASLLALSSILGFASIANAATFNFSFSNEDGPVAGTVEGTIKLPDGDFDNQPASSIVVTSAPPALGYTLPFDVLANFTSVIENTFTVAAGAVDPLSSRFTAFVTPPPSAVGSAFSLNGTPVADFGGTLFSVDLTPIPSSGVFDADNSTLSYSAASATTPDPTSVITLIGAGVLGVASKKLKKKA